MTLVLYVLLDHIVGYISAAAAKISSCPQVPTPIHLSQTLKLAEHFMRRLALQSLHQTAYAYLRRNRYEQMNMIPRYMTLDDFCTGGPTYLSDHVTHSGRNISLQNLLPILRDPHQMQVDLEYRMRSMTIIAHGKVYTKPMLKLPPKGGGFNPPKVGQ